jgi:hypothetical protein
VAEIMNLALHLFDNDAVGRFWKQLQIWQAGVMARRREIVETKLLGGVGLGLFFGSPSETQGIVARGRSKRGRTSPGRDCWMAGHHREGTNRVRDDEHIGVLRHALARFAAVRAHERESVGPPHRRKPAGEGESAFERRAEAANIAGAPSSQNASAIHRVRANWEP